VACAILDFCDGYLCTMIERLREFIARQNLWKADERILLAVSGGLDSMVMLHLVYAAQQPCEVAHVNFQLRGQASDEDEAFVQQTCQQLNVPFHATRFDTNKYAAANKLSIQMAARALRYQWFQEIAAQRGCQKIATAHHLTDAVETNLLNWVRGYSYALTGGLRAQSGRIVRPLLFATHAELVQYAQQNGIAWREDQSNLGDNYHRNFIRHRVLPLLREVNPSLEHTWYRGMNLREADEAALQNYFTQWRQRFVTAAQVGWRLDKTGLAPENGSVSMLYRWLAPHGFNEQQCEDLLRSLPHTGRRFRSGDVEVFVEAGQVVLQPAQVTLPPVVIAVPASAARGSERLTFTELGPTVFSAMPHVACLDADTVGFPLTWRNWHEGDYFYPLGMEHRKKVSDFLIDAKVGASAKEHVTVLESGGEIIWLVGHRIDHRYRVTETTRRMLQIQWEKL
jgi:tRNA(Ile)-lysidine synthase